MPPTRDPTNPDYYRQGGIETIDFIEAKGLDFREGNVVKYVTRWREKNGVEDLLKARWYLDRLIAEASTLTGNDPEGRTP